MSRSTASPCVEWVARAAGSGSGPARTPTCSVEATASGGRWRSLRCPDRDTAGRRSLPVFPASLTAGTAYLVIGVLVWMLGPEREEAFAFALFCSVVASAFMSFQTHDGWYGTSARS